MLLRRMIAKYPFVKQAVSDLIIAYRMREYPGAISLNGCEQDFKPVPTLNSGNS